MTMTPEQLAAIKARIEATPRGPWHVEYFGDEGYPQRVSNQQAILIASTHEGGPAGLRPIPEFIAHARQDVDDLLAEVDRLRTRAEALRVNRDQLKAKRTEADAVIADLENARVADAKRMLSAEAEAERLTTERDAFAMHLVNQIEHHKQRPGHEQLDRRACQNCAAFKALSEYPVIQAAHAELFRGLLNAIETGNYIACPAPEDGEAL